MTNIEALEKHYTIREVADILGCHYNTARKLIIERKIGHFNIDRARILIPASELNKYLEKYKISAE